ncbi:MAG TPA: hypothetical protein ENI15_01930 [Spirochaetes bacterium]|nr:hypothetical protein [Spirochaetota bacterium]
MGSTGENNHIRGVNCLFPTPEHPFYHLKLYFISDEKQPCRINKALINGKPVRDFYVYHNNIFQKTRQVKSGGLNEIIIRFDWKRNEDINVEIKGTTSDKKQPYSRADQITAPPYGGYWDPSWKYYAGIVCKETAGLSRINEPVHVTLALYSDRVTDPAKELRIVAIDPESGITAETPSQVYEKSNYDCERPDERYQPTTICEVAFLADVPANSSRVYLAFYGNPGADAPNYKKGLTVSGQGLGLTLENQFYNVRLAETSGAIDEINVKMGVDVTFDHHLETNGALHWNPGIYAPPRPWLHASDWDPPERQSSTVGNIFTMTRRNGTMEHYPEAEISITYTFYDRVPWILMSSTIEITGDIDVKALRNGEVVFNRKVVKEFAWREPGGKTGSTLITDLPRHPRRAMVLPHDTPWVCFFNRDLKSGLGLVTVDLANFRKDGGFSRTFQPYSYLHWGPWVYYARPLVYTYISSNPGKMINVPAGNVYYEKMAFVPLRFERDDKTHEYLERIYKQLSNPLYINVIEDTDDRAPREFMPPILVEEFEEMEDG